MEGFDCKKCGGGNVEYVWDDFSSLGKGIARLKCLNQSCENYMMEVDVWKYEIL